MGSRDAGCPIGSFHLCRGRKLCLLRPPGGRYAPRFPRTPPHLPRRPALRGWRPHPRSARRRRNCRRAQPGLGGAPKSPEVLSGRGVRAPGLSTHWPGRAAALSTRQVCPLAANQQPRIQLAEAEASQRDSAIPEVTRSGEKQRSGAANPTRRRTVAGSPKGGRAGAAPARQPRPGVPRAAAAAAEAGLPVRGALVALPLKCRGRWRWRRRCRRVSVRVRVRAAGPERGGGRRSGAGAGPGEAVGGTGPGPGLAAGLAA